MGVDTDLDMREGEENRHSLFPWIILALVGSRQEEYSWIYKISKDMSERTMGGVIELNCSLTSVFRIKCL